jgi:hypothetical protein
MKSVTILVALFSGLALATPIEKRQNATDLDALYAAYEEVPDVPEVAAPPGEPPARVPTYDPTAVITVTTNATDTTDDADTTVTKRGGCTPDVISNYAGSVSPDTDTAFLNDPTIAQIATMASAPAGYVLVNGFKNLKASAQDGSYMTYWASQIQSYDVNACASKCTSITGCNGFNICESAFSNICFGCH